MNDKDNHLLKSILYAFSAQAISLVLSTLMSLFIPKLLGLEEFGYWQLFLFYSSFVGFFLFGLNDGIYLRIGGSKYEEIEYSLIGTQLRISVIIQIIFSIIVVYLSMTYMKDDNRIFVIICTAAYLVLYNTTGFIGSIFQAVNMTKVFSISVMFDKVIFLFSLVVLLIFGTDNFQIFIILYLLSKSCSLLYSIFIGKKIIFSSWCNISNALKNAWLNISIGIKLMLANIASILVLGIGRIVIDNVWGITAFGKFSFSLTLTNFFLVFISQISMVLFPALRNVGEQRLKTIYSLMRDSLGLFLPLVFLAYIPIKYILGLWLPQYQESLKYLAILLPICTFDGKMQLLCNTYYKVLREEKKLLLNNLIAMFISIVLSLFGAYVIDSIHFIILVMVISIAIRSIISELYLAKLIGTDIKTNIILESILVMIFMSCSWFLDSKIAFVVVIICYLLFLLINKSKMVNCITEILKLRK